MTREIDDLITEALASQDREILEATKELGYLELGLRQFGGRYGWVTWLVMVMQVSMFLAGVWFAVQFFAAADALAALKTGLPAVVLFLGGLQIKLSLAPQMQADRVIREVKRVELLLAARS